MSAISGVSAADSSSMRANYLNLLVQQLRNQDPLDPMDNNQMTAQLAQLSELEQLEGVNSKFDQVLLLTQRSQATSLIGKTVTYSPDGQATLQGVVDAVKVVGGKVHVQIGQQLVEPDAVLSVSNG